MLRIAKSTPGVLDLSAVKDEHGLPVTLIGASHRDVPDHEGDNPVLQRIVELGWVTMSPVPLAVPDEEPPTDSVPTIDQPPASTVTSDVEIDAKEPSTSAPPPSSVETGDGMDTQDPAPDAGAEQAPDAATPDASAKLESSARSSGKSDARKAGRRS
jgi:cytoskeletal protein RodZ